MRRGREEAQCRTADSRSSTTSKNKKINKKMNKLKKIYNKIKRHSFVCILITSISDTFSPWGACGEPQLPRIPSNRRIHRLRVQGPAGN